MLAYANLHGLVAILVLLIGLGCLFGAAFRAWHRDVLTAGILVVVAVVCFYVAA